MIKTSFNKGWMFQNVLRDTEPVAVTLPHDAMQTEPRIDGISAGTASAFFPGGKYTYTKTFTPDSSYEGKAVILEFGGIYRDSKVYLNDEKVGGWLYGYTGFTVDLTGKLKIGEPNEIRVEADNSHTPNSRWYTGSGIYRNVYLHVGDPVHIQVDGIRVKTLQTDPVEIEVETELSKPEGTKVTVEVLDGGNVLASAEGNPCTLTVPDAELWSADHPALYDVRVTVRNEQGDVVDSDICRTGFRMLTWNGNEGLLVNGKAVKLRGGCIHHDNGILGAAAPKEAEYRKAAIMKKAGYNAIRSAHNPISKEMLAACDELGMYIMDETYDVWVASKSDYDCGLFFEEEWQKDCGALIHKDFSHPSVILYSIGNEIQELATEDGHRINAMLADFFRSADPSRPVTNAINTLVAFAGTSAATKQGSLTDTVDPYAVTGKKSLSGSQVFNKLMTVIPFLMNHALRPKMAEKKIGPVMEKLDAIGFNYAESLYEPLHKQNPDRILFGSETFPKGMAKRWEDVEKYPFVIGDFCWTAVDYLGEVGVGVPEYGTSTASFNEPFPYISGGCGTIDLLGDIGADACHAAAAWKTAKEPVIAVRPVQHAGEKYALGPWRGTDALFSWSFDGCEGKEAEIEVYSNAASVELFQDGVSLGKQKPEHCVACFKAPYRAGTLKAVAYDMANRKTGEATLTSANKETRLAARAEKTALQANGEDMTFVRLTLEDDNGILKMLEDTRVTVEVSGAADLLALGSANSYQEDSYLGKSILTYYGVAGCWIRSNGEAGTATIRACAENGLETTAEVVFD